MNPRAVSPGRAGGIRISVCMATCNGEQFIKQQVGSVLDQLSAMDEIVVSDDRSLDRTIRIIKAFNDPRIQIVTNPYKKGVVPNFENALQAARGKYIFLADQDDIWHPAKVTTQLSCLERYDLVVSDCVLIDEEGGVIHPSYFRLRHSGKGVVKNIVANTYMGACMAFNRMVLEKAVPFPQNISMHDWWIGLIGDMFGNTFFCREKLVYYRRHGKNMSPPVGSKKFSFYKKMDLRKQMVLPLAKKWIENAYAVLE